MKVTTVLVILCVASVWAQQPPGCICNNTTNTCQCCASAPNFPIFSACATLVWKPATGNIDASLSLENNPVFDAIFNATNPKSCFNISSVPASTVCFTMSNYFVAQTGTCGEFNVEINFIFSIQFPLGVFALGSTSSFACPANPYPPIPPPPPSTFEAEKHKVFLTKLHHQLQQRKP